MISEKLLSEVLKGDVSELISFNLNADESAIVLGFNDSVDYINIHELAHKCKEWAWKQGSELSSFKSNYTGINHCTIKLLDVLARPISFSSNTEPEAIFKACEWILKQK